MAEWLRRLTHKPKVRTAVGSNPVLDSLVAVRNASLGRPVPYEGNLVAAAGSCSSLMVKHPWPLLEISLSDFRNLPAAFRSIRMHLFQFLFQRQERRDLFKKATEAHVRLYRKAMTGHGKCLLSTYLLFDKENVLSVNCQ